MADEAKTKDFEVTNGNIVTGDALKKAGLVK